MKQISLDKAGDTYVRLEADLLGKPLVVEAGYDCDEMGSNGEALRYSYGGGKPKERGRMQQTRDDLAKLLGVPPLLAGWTAFIDGEKLKFNKLKQVFVGHSVLGPVLCQVSVRIAMLAH